MNLYITAFAPEVKNAFLHFNANQNILSCFKKLAYKTLANKATFHTDAL